MHESGLDRRAVDDIRRALRALEEAVALQQLRLKSGPPGGEAMRAALESTVSMMQCEADRLRALLSQG